MELVDGSLLKGFSGKIDGLIVYTVGEKTYARKKPEKVRDPKTGKQLRQRAKFPAVQAFYQSVKSGILKKVYDLAAKEGGSRSGYHCLCTLISWPSGEMVLLIIRCYGWHTGYSNYLIRWK